MRERTVGRTCSQWANIISECTPREGKQVRGRPKRRSRDKIEEVGSSQWMRMAEDRSRWCELWRSSVSSDYDDAWWTFTLLNYLPFSLNGTRCICLRTSLIMRCSTAALSCLLKSTLKDVNCYWTVWVEDRARLIELSCSSCLLVYPQMGIQLRLFKSVNFNDLLV